MSLSPVVEALEQRTLLSAPYDFAGVGVRLDGSVTSVLAMTGQLAADNTASGTQVLAGLVGLPVTGPLDFATIERLSPGRILTTPRSGVDPYASQVGANFLAELGYGVGSFYGQMQGPGAAADVQFLVQRPSGVTISWAGSGTYDFEYLDISAAGMSIHAGHFYYTSPETTTVTWFDTTENIGSFTINVTSQDADGTLHLGDGRTVFTGVPSFILEFFPNRRYTAGEAALIVDTDNSDGHIGIGVARRFSDSDGFSGPSGLQGLYRTNILTSGPVGDDFFSAHPIVAGLGSARIMMDLDFHGNYHIYDLAAYDAGDRTALSSGTWDVADFGSVANRGNILTLTSSNGAQAHFMLTYRYHDLVPYFVVSSDGVSEQLLGDATTFSGYASEQSNRFGHVSLDDKGHAIFYQGESGFRDIPQVPSWDSVDLIQLWGGKPLVSVESVRVRQDNSIYMVVGVASDGDVLVWDRGYNGRWIFRNITQDLGAERLVSAITIFAYRQTSFLPSLAVAGKNSDGEIVLYTPTLDYDHYGVYPWAEVNVSETQLTPFGQATPNWVGPVTGYQTSWRGMNIVGLDANGDIIVAWTALDRPHWFTTNLSVASGTTALTGSLGVILTDWNGIHIYGLDAQGQLKVTWWVPELGSHWLPGNLTTELQGPLLDTARATPRSRGFVAMLGVGQTLNIFGYDGDGRLRVYWWSPGSHVWNIGDVNNSFPAASNPGSLATFDYAGSLDPQAGSGGQSLYGYNDDGTFSRVWWAPDVADAWHVENLTEVAVPIVN